MVVVRFVRVQLPTVSLVPLQAAAPKVLDALQALALLLLQFRVLLPPDTTLTGLAVKVNIGGGVGVGVGIAVGVGSGVGVGIGVGVGNGVGMGVVVEQEATFVVHELVLLWQVLHASVVGQ